MRGRGNWRVRRNRRSSPALRLFCCPQEVSPMGKRTWIGGCVVACVIAGACLAEEPEWSAGVASVKITPQKPIPLAGYAARTAPFEGVDMDIFAKALALRDG